MRLAGGVGALFGLTLAGAFVYSTSVALRYVEQALDRGGYFDPGIRDADWHRQGQRTLSEAFPTHGSRSSSGYREGERLAGSLGRETRR